MTSYSSVSQTYGQQDGSAYNGYFCCECYHHIFCFNQNGDVEAALLRNGNVVSAHDWRLVTVPVIDRHRDMDIAKLFGSDAAFAIPELYELLETKGYRYTIRITGNEVLCPPDEAFSGPVTDPNPSCFTIALSIRPPPGKASHVDGESPMAS